MSKSIAQKKAQKKAKGAKKYGHGLGRDRSRAPHYLPGPKEKGTAQMLVRNGINELVAIEVDDWHRAEDLTATEVLTVRAVFRDGQIIERQAIRTYSRGEREEIFEAEFSKDEAVRAKALRYADEIRRYRWSEKQRLLGEMQRAYGKGLPR